MKVEIPVKVQFEPLVVVFRNDAALQREADALAADLKTSTDQLKAAEAAAASGSPATP